MTVVFGVDRRAVLARELTKLHETILSAELGELDALLERDPNQRKGEFVILVAGALKKAGVVSPEAVRVLDILRESLPLKQAASLAARISGEKKNQLYQLALKQDQG